MNEDRLSDMLDSSAPSTPEITPTVASELRRLRATTGSIRGRSPRWIRPALAGFAAVALLAGVGTAAAASGAWTLPWAERSAVASIDYTVPSGLGCELRIGGITSTVPAVKAAVEDFYRTTDMAAVVTADAIQAKIEYRRQRAQELGGNVWTKADGSTEPSGFGTSHYDADQEYADAVLDLVFSAMDDDLARRGLAFVDKDWTLQAEPMCPGPAR
ncbi:hypothetical protein BH11ACT4_BH11ACT4_07730 [soil metagenome]